jgi:tetratricopeptide (TPR) repeat protein
VVSRKFIAILLLVGFTIVACGNLQDRESMKQAKDALKQGNMKVAINNTKSVLKKSPRNISARRMLSKIKTTLLNQGKDDLEAKKYKDAVTKMETLLDLDPQDEEAKKLLNEAKKYSEFANAKQALETNNPMVALRSVQEALRLDPQFQEAKELEVEAKKQVQIRIDSLVTTAQQLISQQDFEKLRDLAQDILAIDPQNKEAADFLREALAQILSRNREKNLKDAREFYSQGVYESALSKAEEVLKVDPESDEAKELVQKSHAELAKPDLRLTGLTKIKGMIIAHIEVPSTREKFLVKEGETFLNEGDFKVSAIDLDLKAVVLTYVKTGTQTTISIAPPELGANQPPAAPAQAPDKAAAPAKAPAKAPAAPQRPKYF